MLQKVIGVHNMHPHHNIKASPGECSARPKHNILKSAHVLPEIIAWRPDFTRTYIFQKMRCEERIIYGKWCEFRHSRANVVNPQWRRSNPSLPPPIPLGKGEGRDTWPNDLVSLFIALPQNVRREIELRGSVNP